MRLAPHADPRLHGPREPPKVRVHLPELLVELRGQVRVAVLRRAAREVDPAEERDQLFLPEQPLVLLLQVGEGVRGLVVVYVRLPGLDAQVEMVRADLRRPAGEHVVVPPPRLPIAHQALHDRGPDALPVEGEVHGAHGVQGPRRHRDRRVHVPAVPLQGLQELRGRVVVRHVEPDAVRHRGRHAAAEAVGVPANEVCVAAVWVVERVEEVRRGGAREIAVVLEEGVDERAVRLGGREDVIVQGENVLFLRDEEAEVPHRRVLRADDPRPVAEDPADVVPVVKLKVDPLRDVQGDVWVAVLDDDDVRVLQEGLPSFEEVHVADGGHNDVHLLEGLMGFCERLLPDGLALVVLQAIALRVGVDRVPAAGSLQGVDGRRRAVVVVGALVDGPIAANGLHDLGQGLLARGDGWGIILQLLELLVGGRRRVRCTSSR
mmetsp:Transcript_139098/g.432773  ORF Transcript_139098/g.432773 Transcript_139098/m.432773 type:complete len:433 (-) Transcript_139098:159-1457(-)